MVFLGRCCLFGETKSNLVNSQNLIIPSFILLPHFYCPSSTVLNRTGCALLGTTDRHSDTRAAGMNGFQREVMPVRGEPLLKEQCVKCQGSSGGIAESIELLIPDSNL